MFRIVGGNRDGGRGGIVAEIPVPGNGICGADVNRVRSRTAEDVRKFAGHATSGVHVNVIRLVHAVAVDAQHTSGGGLTITIQLGNMGANVDRLLDDGRFRESQALHRQIGPQLYRRIHGHRVVFGKAAHVTAQLDLLSAIKRGPGKAVISGRPREITEILTKQRHAGWGERSESYIGETARRGGAGIQLSGGELTVVLLSLPRRARALITGEPSFSPVPSGMPLSR